MNDLKRRKIVIEKRTSKDTEIQRERVRREKEKRDTRRKGTQVTTGRRDAAGILYWREKFKEMEEKSKKVTPDIEDLRRIEKGGEN